MSADGRSHSRRNLLTGEWVLVSPHRTERPWQGQIEKAETPSDKQYDANCYLCPGNQRANNRANPDYVGTFVFDNDFPALSASSSVNVEPSSMFATRTESGNCRVVCYTQRHDQRIATMSVDEIAAALATLTGEFVRLDQSDNAAYVQVFENRGQMMGCSNPHPHAQIWATENIPNEPTKELDAQRNWWKKRQSPLLADYRLAELNDGSRLLADNEQFIVVVPYWAIWPFETMLIPKRNFSSFEDMTREEVSGLAEILKKTLSGYDRLFDAPAPYSLGFHPRPSDGERHPEWIFHAHIYPPMLRSASIRKHLVGFEMLAMPQRDLTPESAAERLRNAMQ